MDELFEAYVGTLCTIFIDEAQLLNDDQFEFLRILSDTKLFQFVLVNERGEMLRTCQSGALSRSTTLGVFGRG